MADDFQSIVIERLKKLEENVGKLDSNGKSLKSSHKKLSDKFKEIEIQGFHDQIQALNKRVDDIQESMLSSSQVLADLIIEYTQFHFLYIVSNKLRDKPNLYHRIKEHIIIESTIAHQTCANVSIPIKTALEFRENCVNYSKQQKLGVYQREI